MLDNFVLTSITPAVMERILTYLLCMSMHLSYAQIGNKGVPNIKNFTFEQYRAGAQNWSVLQDDQGKMLFGNNYGLLEYNGQDWNLVIQPTNKTVVRCLHKGKDSLIYVGAQNEFGYVKTNDAGQRQYVSLIPKVPTAERQFSDVWSIAETSSGIYFHTTGAIYFYNGDTIAVLHTPPLSSFSKVGDSILVQDQSLNIQVVKPGGLQVVYDSLQVGHYVLKIYDDHQGGLQLVTQRNGILELKGGKFVRHHINNSFLENNKIQSLLKLRNGFLAIGSVGAGLLILDENFKPIQWFSKNNGLQSNTILAMGTDHIGNLWVATETGIDYVEIATPLYQIADNYNLEGTVSSMLMHKDILYVGTNTGVYFSPWNAEENPLEPTLNFTEIPGLSGQVWNLYEIRDEVYVCHHDGLFKLINNQAFKIDPGTGGAWNLLKLQEKGNLYLQGAYDGIHLYRLKSDELSYLWKVEGFDETSRVIEKDDKGNLWMAHGYKGIYRLRLDSNLKKVTQKRLYTAKDGFPTSLFINLFKINNKILFGTEQGTYQYDSELDSMIADPLYTRILGSSQHIRLLKEDKGDVWFLKGHDMQDDLGIIEFYDNEKYEVIRSPLQHLRGRFNPGFENITVLDDQTVLFGTKSGITLLDRRVNRNFGIPYHSSLTEVRCLMTDSVLYGGVIADRSKQIVDHVGLVQLPYDHNSVSFRFASNYFESAEHTLYSCYLEGFDKGWYDWQDEQTKNYTNLAPGSYTFHVKARNIYGAESKEGTYAFMILPPWYLTKTAKVAYGLLALVAGLGLLKVYRLRIERVQKKERLAQLDVLRKNRAKYYEEKLLTEQELIKLRNEKLEAEVAISRSKMEVLNAEMAASIMMITQKNNMLMKVRDDLGLMLRRVKDTNKKPIERVIRHINNDINSDQDWEQFKIHFDKVHENFLERLKCEYPDLTPKDLQLAAYLRLNLSSKEIASMMNITIRSIEGCRYRLRKHLNLNGSVNLNEFILKY